MMLTKTSPHPSVHAFFASRLACLPECFIARHPGPLPLPGQDRSPQSLTPSGNLRQSDSFRRKDWVGNLLRIRKFEDLAWVNRTLRDEFHRRTLGNRSLDRQFPGGAW